MKTILGKLGLTKVDVPHVYVVFATLVSHRSEYQKTMEQSFNNAKTFKDQTWTVLMLGEIQMNSFYPPSFYVRPLIESQRVPSSL